MQGHLSCQCCRGEGHYSLGTAARSCIRAVPRQTCLFSMCMHWHACNCCGIANVNISCDSTSSGVCQYPVNLAVDVFACGAVWGPLRTMSDHYKSPSLVFGSFFENFRTMPFLTKIKKTKKANGRKTKTREYNKNQHKCSYGKIRALDIQTRRYHNNLNI